MTKEFKVGPNTYKYDNNQVFVNGVANPNYSPSFINNDFIGVHDNINNKLFMINNSKPQNTVSPDDIKL